MTVVDHFPGQRDGRLDGMVGRDHGVYGHGGANMSGQPRICLKMLNRKTSRIASL